MDRECTHVEEGFECEKDVREATCRVPALLLADEGAPEKRNAHTVAEEVGVEDWRRDAFD